MHSTPFMPSFIRPYPGLAKTVKSRLEEVRADRKWKMIAVHGPGGRRAERVIKLPTHSDLRRRPARGWTGQRHRLAQASCCQDSAPAVGCWSSPAVSMHADRTAVVRKTVQRNVIDVAEREQGTNEIARRQRARVYLIVRVPPGTCQPWPACIICRSTTWLPSTARRCISDWNVDNPRRCMMKTGTPREQFPRAFDVAFVRVGAQRSRMYFDGRPTRRRPHEATEALHGLCHALLIGRNDLAEVFRVHAGRQRR